MNSSFYNSVSGIKSHQFGIDVIADNISNINNVGFKSSTPEFASVFSTTMMDVYESGTTNNFSYGSKAQTNAVDLSQGTLMPTDNVFDMAIQGEGWFGVSGQNNEQYFTRSGSFSLDTNGDLVNDAGQYLLGTSANNLTTADLDQSVLEDYGYSYNGNERSLSNAYSVSVINDVPLSAVSGQSKINLPDFLYVPPIPTSNVSFQANLDPTINKDIDNIALDNSGYPTSVTATNNRLNFSGTLTSDETQIEGTEKTIVLTITDTNGKTKNVNTSLNDDGQTWSLSNLDVSDLNTSENLSISASLQTVTEIPNVEHFTSTVISPSGNKDILDLTFTKEVPQDANEINWNVDAKILSYYEDYTIEQYDPTKVYDENIYNVDTNKNQVTKIYDDTYYIDTTTDKVYKIIDSKEGDVSFNGNGALTNFNLPTLSNGDTPLELDFGNFASTTTITNYTNNSNGSTINLSGTNPEFEAGTYITVTATDSNGDNITKSAVVNKDGSWESSFSISSLDADSVQITVEQVENGFDGLVSNAGLDKAKVVQADGKVAGFLEGYDMDGNGNIVANFDNGVSSAVAKVAIYHFQNDQGLTQTSGNLFQQSSNSGKAIFYTDENGNAFLGSSIYNRKLESSNVKMEVAMTELIIMQKAFDANARGITTSDEMLQRAIEMKT